MRVPGCLTVIMGVHIDETRRHDMVSGVNLSVSSSLNMAGDTCDNTIENGHVTLERRVAAAVVNFTITNNQIILRHRRLLQVCECICSFIVLSTAKI